MVYEALRKHFHYTRAKREADGGEVSTVFVRLEKSFGYLTMGAFAKVVASTTTYPLQVVKARMQQRSEFLQLNVDGNINVVKLSLIHI